MTFLDVAIWLLIAASLLMNFLTSRKIKRTNEIIKETERLMQERHR